MAKTHNEYGLGSCNPPEENRFLYFPYLLEHDDNDAQGLCKRAKHELKEFSELPPPLGLRLTIARTPCKEPPNKVEKLKAVHLPMCSLRIGFYSIEARYPADLVAKFYYARRKLVWEILDKGLKRKVEIEWKNISAIRASIEENKLRNLEIELDRVPSFFHEHTPQRGKRTMWIACSDFTQGCASKYRRHLLRFPAGVLDQHYLKLLQLDKRLLELSRAPFPSSESRYFNANSNEGTTHIPFGHSDLHAHGSGTTPASEQPTVDPPLLSTQQVNQAMPLSFNAMNDLTSPSEHQPAFALPLISTQQVQLYENTMPNDPTTLTSACDQQTTFGLPVLSTQQVHPYDNAMPLSFGAINDPATSLSSGWQQRPTFDLPLVSTQEVQLHDNMMPLLVGAIYNPTSLSSACDQQITFDLPLISAQQLQLYDNTLPLSFNGINDPTSLPSASEQFAFDLPVVSTQQVQPYENTMPLSAGAINESAPLPSGICSPKNEATNNQLFHDPKLATCSSGLDVQHCSFYQQPITFPHNNASLFIDPST